MLNSRLAARAFCSVKELRDDMHAVGESTLQTKMLHYWDTDMKLLQKTNNDLLLM